MSTKQRAFSPKLLILFLPTNFTIDIQSTNMIFKISTFLSMATATNAASGNSVYSDSLLFFPTLQEAECQEMRGENFKKMKNRQVRILTSIHNIVLNTIYA